MSGKKNKKLRKLQRERERTSVPVPGDIRDELVADLPADVRGRTVTFATDKSSRLGPISAALLNVADPWLQDLEESDLGTDAYWSMKESICMLAVAAWNLMRMDEGEERQDALADLLSELAQAPGMDERSLASMVTALVGMMERVEDLYPDDPRYVTSHRMVKENGRETLFAACTVPESEVPASLRAELRPHTEPTSPPRTPTAQIVNIAPDALR